MAVQVIKAKQKPRQSGDSYSYKQRVAAYCRVSTDSEEQESSYEAQCTHYQTYIKSNPKWEFAGIFADEGISGTMARKRPEFLKMIDACMSGEIDLVVTKSISRFARNTLDCLKYIRKLKGEGVAIYFEKENINTLDAKGEVLITIMASIAQQESQSISENTRIGIQYRMQEGKGRLNTSTFLGLTLGEEKGEYEIVPEEAEVVRRIYREYLEGYSPRLICRHLEADGILTPAGKITWYPSTISSILENEKYCGDVLLQKYCTSDFLTHKIVKNCGQFPQYFVENNHAPIVPKRVYSQVQGELMRRGSLKNDPNAIRMGSASALTGRVYCGLCGRALKKYTDTEGGNIDWRCRKRARTKKSEDTPQGQCACRIVPDEEIKHAIVNSFNVVSHYRDDLIRMQAETWSGEIKRINALLDELKSQEMKLEESRVRLEAEESAEAENVCVELETIREKRDQLYLERADFANSEIHIRMLLELIDMMTEWRESYGIEDDCSIDADFDASCSDYEEFFLRTRHSLPEGILNHAGKFTRLDNDIVIRYIDRIIVNEDCYEIIFKAGIRIMMHLPNTAI